MAVNTAQSSNANTQGSWPKRAMTSAMLWSCRFMSGLVCRLWSALVFAALAVLLLPDLLPRRTRQSMTQPTTRKLPLPVRHGSDIFAIMPDGERVKVDPLAAKTHAMAWVDVVTGVAVYERTKLPNANG